MSSSALVPAPLRPLGDMLDSGGSRAERPVRWRLSWTEWDGASVGVKDRHRAGVHAPLALSRGFALDYLFQWPDGRLSMGAADRFAISDPERFTRLAAHAAYEDPDGANFAGPAEIPSTPLRDDALAELAVTGGGASFPALLGIAEQVADAWSFATWSGSVSARMSTRGIVTSEGLAAVASSTLGSYSFWYEGRTGDGHASRSPQDPAEARARLERVCPIVRALGTPDDEFEAGTMPVLLHPDVVDALFSAFVLSNLHGERIHHGQSAFRLDQFGARDPVFAPSLCLRLEPGRAMDPGSYTFTTEGVPARPLSYIEKGRLVEPILDMKYACRLGREPVPGPLSAESLSLTGGRTAGREEALRSMKPHGLLVLSLLGLHTQDPTRGDVSVSAPLSLSVRGGSIGGGVKAVLTGNVFEILRDPTVTFVAFEGFRTPGLLFTGSIGLAPRA